jgi:hypothetical protein
MLTFINNIRLVIKNPLKLELNNLKTATRTEDRWSNTCWALGPAGIGNSDQVSGRCRSEYGGDWYYTGHNQCCSTCFTRQGLCRRNVRIASDAQINAKLAEIDALVKRKYTLAESPQLQIPQFDVNACIDFVNTKIKLEDTQKKLEEAIKNANTQMQELRNNITNLVNQKNSTQREFDEFRLSKEKEKADLVKQFQTDLTDLKDKNIKEQQALIDEFKIAKQKSIDEITALFNKREDEYQGKIKEINDKIIKLQKDEVKSSDCSE